MPVTMRYPGMDVTEFGSRPQAPIPPANTPQMPRNFGQTTNYPGMDVTEYGARPQAPASNFNPPTLTDVHTPPPAGIPQPTMRAPNPSAVPTTIPGQGAAPVPGTSLTTPNSLGNNYRPDWTYGGQGGRSNLPALRGPSYIDVDAREVTPPSMAGAFGAGAALGAGGSAATALAGGTMRGASQANRSDFYASPMTGAMSGDAGFAAAIMNAGEGNLSPRTPTPYDGGAGRGRINPDAVDPRLTSMAGAGRGSVNPSMTSESIATGPALPGAVGSAAGMPVAGAAGVRRFTTPDGKTLYSNVAGDNSDMTGKGGTVTSVPSDSDVMGRNMRAASIYASMRHAEDVPSGQAVTVLGGGGVDLRDPGYLAARNASFGSGAAGGGRGGRAQQALDIQNRNALMQDATQRRGQDVTSRGQDLNYGATLRGQDVTSRGQDLNYDASMFGHNVSALGNRARLAYDMFKDNRDFGLRSQEANQKSSESAQASDQKMLESMFRTQDAKGNDVADSGKIASYRTAVNATLPSMIEEARTNAAAVAKTNPQLAQALGAKADDLEKRGYGALGPDEHQHMKQLFDTRDRMEQSRGPMPGSGTFKRSDNLLEYRQLPGEAGVKKRLIGGDRIVTNAGDVSVNDLKYDTPANSVLPDWFKIQNGNLTRGLRTN